MDYELINNEAGKQFEFHIDGHVAKIVYKKMDDKIYLVHTEVPNELAGRGIATLLVKKIMEVIRQKELKLVPICPFVKNYIQRNPEYRSLVVVN